MIFAGFMSAVLLLSVDGIFVNPVNSESSFRGMEQTAVQKNQTVFMAENGYCSENGFFRTNEYAFEGSYSIKLDTLNRYGLSTAFEIPKSQDSVDASVWIYSAKIQNGIAHEAYIVASIGDVFWKGSNIIVDSKMGWHKLNIKFSVPDTSYQKPLTIYCWNNNNYEVYFDNFIISKSNFRKYF